MDKTKPYKILIYAFLIFILFIPLFPTKVATGNTIKIYKIPLFAKLGSFLEREYRYRAYVNEITKDCATDQQKILAIYYWVLKNIKNPPPDTEAIDDHEFNILIRRYATPIEKVRIFCILTTFAGYPGQESQCNLKYNNLIVGNRIALVRLKERWLFFDLINNLFFWIDGRIAGIDEIRLYPERLVPNGDIVIDTEIFCKGCGRLKSVTDLRFTRGHLQMSAYRFLYEMGVFLRRVPEVKNLYDL